jgi:hypothetical protein
MGKAKDCWWVLAPLSLTSKNMFFATASFVALRINSGGSSRKLFNNECLERKRLRLAEPGAVAREHK